MTMELETLWRIIDEGSTPAILLIAYFLWKVDKTLTSFVTEVRATMHSSDAKLTKISNNIDEMILKLSGLGDKNA